MGIALKSLDEHRMLHLANLLLICLLLAHLEGLSLLAYKFSRSWLLARAASPLLVAIPFCIEHFFGFGRLAWLLPISTAVSVVLILRHLPLIRANWRIEAIFHAAFAYALAWRYSYPDINESSEKLTDVTFVANYIRGDRLPPMDRWLPPFPFDMYYALQHYGAALMGRILETPAGTAYNLAICVIVAAVVTAAAGAAWLLVRRPGPALLLTAALVFGGTGASPFIRLVMPSTQLHSSIRFLGSSLSPQLATRPFGQWLLRVDSVPGKTPLDLPVELFSYLVGLGDYHPPLSGYLLLMVALLAIALIEAEESVLPAYAVLAATVPLSIPCNAWDFPIQMFLVGAYLFYRLWISKPVEWKAFSAGGVSAALLIYPFLARFAPHASGLHNALRLVPRGLHTPPVAGLLVFYPLLVVLALSLICGERSSQSLAFCAIWVALLAASEFLFIDDIYGGQFERFNTVLKWWSWIYSGTLLTVGAVNLRSPSRVCRWGTGAVLVLISAYGADLYANLVNLPKPHLGQLDGSAWLRDDKAQRAILEFLQTQPDSIVLQRLPDRSYIPAPALITFSGQTPFLGWANHEDIWRGYRADIEHRSVEIGQFYSGDLPEAERWLEQNRIRYILWLQDENKLPAGTFEKIDEQIHSQYLWSDYSAQPGSRVGLWSLTTWR
jgi:uncharacterized membrane protein